MQIKTVKKIITKKMEAWLETLPEDIRTKVRNNLLVTGGSIVSLLNNEEVNDFDVYIQDMDVLKKLVEHYSKPFAYEILDGRTDRSGEERDSEVTSDSFNSVAHRTLKPDQIKILVSGGERVNEDVPENEGKYAPMFFSPNAISLTDKVQIVCRFHGTAEQIHKTFDFIHATNYFTFSEGLVLNQPALESIITKQLRYQGSLYPLTTIIRMKKFIKRGWNVSAGEMLKVMYQISMLDLNNPDVLEEQLIGVDVAYFGILIDILRGIPSDKRSPEYLSSLIDKVFNEDGDYEEA